MANEDNKIAIQLSQKDLIALRDTGYAFVHVGDELYRKVTINDLHISKEDYAKLKDEK